MTSRGHIAGGADHAAWIDSLKHALDHAMKRGAIRGWTYEPLGAWRIEPASTTVRLPKRTQPLTSGQVELFAAGLAAGFTTDGVYMAIVDTDVGGIGYVVRFPDEAAVAAWECKVDKLRRDSEEPFGFRDERGVTQRILTPDEALEMVRKAQVYSCHECGKDMVVNGDGATNHLLAGSTGVDAIDHDADEDHVAYTLDL